MSKLHDITTQFAKKQGGINNVALNELEQQIKDLMLELLEESSRTERVYDQGEVLDEVKIAGYHQLRQKVEEL